MSRSHGMSRASAARTSDAVDGPSARRCAKRMKSSRASGQLQPSGTEPAGRSDVGQQRAQQPQAEVAGRDAFVALRVFVDDGVDARLVGAARLAERDFLAGDVLQLDRDVLEHVAEPRAFVLAHAPEESAGLAVRAAVLGQSGQRGGQAIDVRRPEPARRPGFERAEVQLQPDDRKMRVQRRADVNRTIENLHGRATLLRESCRR